MTIMIFSYGISPIVVPNTNSSAPNSTTTSNPNGTSSVKPQNQPTVKN